MDATPPNAADHLFMRRAIALSRQAAAAGDAPYGAILVRAGVAVAEACNRQSSDADCSAHAEMVLVRDAQRALGTAARRGATVYASGEPCAMCAGAISFARIRRLYWAANDPKGGAVEHGPRFFSQPTCHHAPELYGGIRESEAAEMLREFFKARR